MNISGEVLCGRCGGPITAVDISSGNFFRCNYCASNFHVTCVIFRPDLDSEDQYVKKVDHWECPVCHAIHWTEITKPRPVQTGGCFIATAALGSPLAPEIYILREFRDRFLRANVPGRLAVRAYYSFSPPIARIIEKSKLLRYITNLAIVRPWVWLSRRILGK